MKKIKGYFNRVIYGLISLYSILYVSQILPKHDQKFVLITTLYNETHEQRRNEYITCLEKNLRHPLISTIHVLYDTAKDDQNNYILNYLKQKKVIITYIQGRPTYGFCFDLTNKEYPNSKVILSNADIYFNETLAILDSYDFNNKFIALTRWNEKADGSIELFKQFKRDGSFDDTMSYLSQDVWIFKTPLKQFENQNFQLGTWCCDGYIAYQAYVSGLEVVNPCLSIQCCHLHLSEVRNWYPQSIPGAKALINPWCRV